MLDLRCGRHRWRGTVLNRRGHASDALPRSGYWQRCQGGPKGPDGKEVKPNKNFNRVIPLPGLLNSNVG